MQWLMDLMPKSMDEVIAELRSRSALELLGAASLLLVSLRVTSHLMRWIEPWVRPLPPLVTVPLLEAEALDVLPHAQKFDPLLLDKGDQKTVYMWDPSTMDYLGEAPAMGTEQVRSAVDKARAAQKTWVKSSFATRRKLMRIMLRYITTNQESCARVAVRESGKTRLCTALGEVMVTCEKVRCAALCIVQCIA
jgi:hypothetical protein